MSQDEYQQFDNTLDEINQNYVERSYLDRDRYDLINKGDMLQIFRFILEDKLDGIDEKRKRLFFSSTGKAIHSTFLEKEDQLNMSFEFEYSNLLWAMNRPRCNKDIKDIITTNEMRMHLLAGVRRSQGFQQNKTNVLTLMSTIFRHNVNTISDMGTGSSGGGLMSRLGGLFKKF
jgi:hypothetical protein